MWRKDGVILIHWVFANKIKNIISKSSTIRGMIDKKFWDAHHVDIIIRKDGNHIAEEADWIKDLFYIALDDKPRTWK